MDDVIIQKQTEAIAEYADLHGLYGLFEDMLAKCLITKPEDIFSFFIDYLRKPKVPEIIVIGPSSSGLSKIAQTIAAAKKSVYISASDLILNAIARGNIYGNQARSYFEKRELVPDSVIASLVISRLKDDDVKNYGYLLYGYPKTKAQARAMQRAGLIPQHVVVIDIPDEKVIESAGNNIFDPMTGIYYNLKYNPPTDMEVEKRLIQKLDDSEEVVLSHLADFRRHIAPVVSCFTDNLRKFTYNDGVFFKDEEVVTEVLSYIGQQHIARYPREYKISVSGLPGCGKTTIAELLSNTYGFTLLSSRTLILEHISSKGPHFHTQPSFVNNPDEAPREMILELLNEKLKSKACIENGWILDGFPLNLEEGEYLKKMGIIPNRVFWLDVDATECIERLKKRRYDADTGVETASGTIQNPQDRENFVIERIEKSKGLKEDLQKMYGNNFQGAPGNLNARNTYEYVNALLLRPA